MTSEVEERPRVVIALYGGLGVNGLNTHNLDMILQLKYTPIVMNPARIASSDWKS